MPNPRYLSHIGEPTPELLDKISLGKNVIYSNLNWFCEKWSCDPAVLGQVDRVYLIGSHAKPRGWKNDTSDLDIKIVNGNTEMMPHYLHLFRKEVLRPLLCRGEKHRWIDFYFVKEEYQVLSPKWDLTPYWNKIEIDIPIIRS